MASVALMPAAPAAPSSGILEQDADLLDKLTALRRQVAATSHPRIRLPSTVIAALEPVALNVSGSIPAQAAVIPSSHAAALAASARKADEQARADLALRRHQAETLMRQEADLAWGSTLQNGNRPGKDEAEDFFAAPNNLDVAAIYAKVQGLGTYSAIQRAAVADRPRSAASSRDEDSYYSSKAPDSWSGRSEEGEIAPDGDAAPRAAGTAARDDSYSPPPPAPMSNSHRPNRATDHGFGSTTTQPAAYIPLSTSDRESGSYSPPPPPVASGNGIPTGPRSRSRVWRRDQAAPAAVPASQQVQGQHALRTNSGTFQGVNNQAPGRHDANGSKHLTKRQRREKEAAQREMQQAQQRSHAAGPARTHSLRSGNRQDDGPSRPSRVTSGYDTFMGRRASPLPYIKPEPTSPPALQPLSAMAPPPPPPLALMPPPPSHPLELVAHQDAVQQDGARLVVREDGRVELVSDPTRARPETQIPREVALAQPQLAAMHNGGRQYPHLGREDGPGLRRVASMPFQTESGQALPTIPRGRRIVLSDGTYGTFVEAEPMERQIMAPPVSRQYVRGADGQEYELLPVSDRSRQSNIVYEDMYAPRMIEYAPPRRAVSQYAEAMPGERYIQLGGNSGEMAYTPRGGPREIGGMAMMRPQTASGGQAMSMHPGGAPMGYEQYVQPMRMQERAYSMQPGAMEQGTRYM